jgi:UDP-glucose 4-epimerase
VAKTVDETLAFAYHRERGLPVVVVRLFNTVGPRQSPAFGMVIPRLVRQALSGEPLTVYGDGGQSRCFCHVSDVVAALVGLLGDDRAIGEVFNIGSTEEITILGLAEKILNSVGGISSIELVPYDQAYEVGFEDVERRVPDTSKLQSLIAWSPKLRLDDILEHVIASARAEYEIDRAKSGAHL